jgi:hypothetical protein
LSEIDEQLEEIRERRYVNLDESQAGPESIEWQSLDDIGWLLGYVEMLRAEVNRSGRSKAISHHVEDQRINVFDSPKIKKSWSSTFTATRKPETLDPGATVVDPPYRCDVSSGD